jgi:hypothetical protein
MNDFEDAAVAICAKKVGADCIVSHDEKFIKAGISVELITPKQLLARLNMNGVLSWYYLYVNGLNFLGGVGVNRAAF